MIRAASHVFAIGLVAAALHIAAAPLPRAEPADVGLAAEGLADLRAEMDGMVARGVFPGIVGMVARRGEVAFAHAAGKLDVETGATMRLDSLLRIYSMTKPITSVAAMMLVEDGVLELDAPVARFFPEWRNMTVLAGDERVPVETPITVRHLLTHTAGLAYGYDGDTEVDRLYRAAGLIDDWDYLVRDTRELVRKLADLPLLFQPGSRWHYGFSTDVLGHLIERASGERLDQFFERRVFAPLGMADAYFDVPESVLGRFGTNHYVGADGTVTVQDSPREDPEFIGVTFLSGGGGLVTTVGDYMRFCLMLASGGSVGEGRLLQAATVAEMTANQLDADDSLRFGLGFAIAGEETNGPLSPGAYYWGGAAGTFFWVDPAKQLIGVFMPQRIGTPNAVSARLQQLVYDTLAD